MGYVIWRITYKPCLKNRTYYQYLNFSKGLCVRLVICLGHVLILSVIVRALKE